MHLSELQEKWDKMTLDLVESGRLEKRKGLQEDSAGTRRRIRRNPKLRRMAWT